MPITFAADFDYKSLKHVSVRPRKQREVVLDPMPTAKDISKWEHRELRVGKRPSDWKPNYEDGVAERRDAQKARMDDEARKRLAANPITLLEELSAIKVRPERPGTQDQRIIADILHGATQELSWSYYLDFMPAFQILDMARRCQEAEDPVMAWNLNVRLYAPRHASIMRYAPRTMVDDPARPSNHKLTSMGFTAKPSANTQISEWMYLAEENRLPNRSTHCAVTGRSLVIKTNYFGRRSWSLAPTFQGMSVEAAQQVASAAAIQMGLVQGVVRGTPPPLVERLCSNAQDWLGLVVATQHPLFYTIASRLLKAGIENLRFSDDHEKNRAEWARLSIEARVSDESGISGNR